tara:strand:+ start:73759 stop:74397 length:639 start_codon:yes stop_codon:yes gene_type:complete
MNLLDKTIWGTLLEKVANTVAEGTVGSSMKPAAVQQASPTPGPAPNPQASPTPLVRPNPQASPTPGTGSGPSIPGLKDPKAYLDAMRKLKSQHNTATPEGQQAYQAAWKRTQKAFGLSTNPQEFGAGLVQQSPDLAKRLEQSKGGAEWSKNNPFLKAKGNQQGGSSASTSGNPMTVARPLRKTAPTANPAAGFKPPKLKLPKLPSVTNLQPK